VVGDPLVDVEDRPDQTLSRDPNPEWLARHEDARPVVADLERPCSYSIVVYIDTLLGKVMA
jgi:hypothetical protein